MKLLLFSLLGLGFLACAGPESPERAALAAAPGPSTPLQAKSVPARIPLTVRETAGVARTGEVLRSGVPLPRSLGVRDLGGLAVLGPDGKPVPAGMVNSQTDNGSSKKIPSVLLKPVAVTQDNIKGTVVKDGFWTVKQICTSAYQADCKKIGLD